MKTERQTCEPRLCVDVQLHILRARGWRYGDMLGRYSHTCTRCLRMRSHMYDMFAWYISPSISTTHQPVFSVCALVPSTHLHTSECSNRIGPHIRTYIYASHCTENKYRPSEAARAAPARNRRTHDAAAHVRLVDDPRWRLESADSISVMRRGRRRRRQRRVHSQRPTHVLVL